MAGYEEFITDGEENASTPRRGHRTHRGVARHATSRDRRPRPRREPTAQLVVESSKLSIDDPTPDRFSPPGPPRDGVVEETVWIDDRFFAICSTPAGRAPAPARDHRVAQHRLDQPHRTRTALRDARALLGEPRIHRGARRPRPRRRQHPRRSGDREQPHGADPPRSFATSSPGFVELDRQRSHCCLGGMCSGAFLALHLAMNGARHRSRRCSINPGVFYLDVGETSSTSEERAFHSAHALDPRLRRRPEVEARAARSRGLAARGAQRAQAVRSQRDVGAFAFWSRPRRATRRAASACPVKASSVLARDLAQRHRPRRKVLLVFAAENRRPRYFRTFGGPRMRNALAWRRARRHKYRRWRSRLSRRRHHASNSSRR